MKRSEIKKEVFELLESIHSHPEGNATLSETILLHLEKLGMQPPAIKEPCETFVLHNGKYVKTEDSFIFTHKWDEE
jgi:hypothetical protein